MLITLAIIAILSTVVIVRFSSFDSTVLLKSAAYDVASSIREAQVYSVSVLGSSGGFDTPYGLSFTPGSKEYNYFRYTGPIGATPRYDTDAMNVLPAYILDRSLVVADVCITTNSNTYCHSNDTNTLTRLDISFRRPEFRALFFAEALPSGVSSNADITSAVVKVHSTIDTANVYTVTVGLLGHITVAKQP